jgi:hypothetical protein
MENVLQEDKQRSSSPLEAPVTMIVFDMLLCLETVSRDSSFG